MKRTLSLILAALLLASSLAACGKTEPNETDAVETKAPETSISETDIAETDIAETNIAETEAPAPAYTTDKITENGAALSHIVLFEGADQLEKLASEELVKHIKLVSGADVAVTDTAMADSLPIIIATPDTLPELETMFPEDLAWLRDTGTPGNKDRSAPDGFDWQATDVIRAALAPLGLELIDHIIFVDGDAVSLRQSESSGRRPIYQLI